MKISVWDCRVKVVRRVDHSPTCWGYQDASNWEELEEQAREEVEAFGGAINISGLYPCSIQLFEQAKFENLDNT